MMYEFFDDDVYENLSPSLGFNFNQNPERPDLHIAFEGVKGSGKSTLVSLVRDELKKAGIITSLYSPTGSITGFSLVELISKQIPSIRKSDRWNEYLYARRAKWGSKKLCRNKFIVISDRSIVTSYVTRWRKWESPEVCIRRVNYLERDVQIPNHIIYLFVRPETALERIKSRPPRNYGQYDEGPEKIKEALENYSEIMRYGIPGLKNSEWHIIDANRNINEVKAEAMDIVFSILSEYKTKEGAGTIGTGSYN